MPKALASALTVAVCCVLVTGFSADKMGAPSFARTSKSAAVQVHCTGPVTATSRAQTIIRCRVENGADQSVYLMVQPLSLEGPADPKTYYVYHYIGGERYENVLQYNHRKNGPLNLPILFKSAVHISLENLETLRRLASGESTELSILWQLPPEPSFPGRGSWNLRIKLIYLKEEAATRLGQPGELPPTCQARLQKGVRNAIREETITLLAERPAAERGFSDDGCRDVISEAFSHLYSNTIQLELK